jgi:hypothetical protein
MTNNQDQQRELKGSRKKGELEEEGCLKTIMNVFLISLTFFFWMIITLVQKGLFNGGEKFLKNLRQKLRLKKDDSKNG